ncbi:hypothetical protein B0O80DRAFT_431860 [Mortierella sp. GBAus27b]|nr:hypothetical protein B0O80DRAFT_431860 [Mortierella sp. GBAus27b]
MYLDNAWNTDDVAIALVLCHETRVSLSQAKKAVKIDENPALVTEEIAAVYVDLGKLLEIREQTDEAESCYRKAMKLGPDHCHYRPISLPSDVRPPTIDYKLPEPDERLTSTPQLVHCLSLLLIPQSTSDLESATQKWLQTIAKDTEEQERLHTVATEVVRAFKRDELKDAKIISEVVFLAPVLAKDTFQGLLRDSYSGIDHSKLLDVPQLEGLAHLIHVAGPGYLDADDLVKILGLFSTRLQGTHRQSSRNMYQLTLAVSYLLDAMADTNVSGLDRVAHHEPPSSYLSELKDSDDPYLVYQAAYAYQALLCISDNEKPWQATMRRTGKVIQGVSELVSAVKGLDLNKFLEGLVEIQKGLAGVSKVLKSSKSPMIL